MRLVTQKKVMAYLIGLLFLFPLSGNAQHFGDLEGNTLNDTWTAYLDEVTLDDETPESGDELGIFDGDTLVGVFTFDGSEIGLNQSGGSEGQTDYPTVCFSELSSGNGYDAGNVITFKFWDDSEEMEIIATTDNVHFLDFDGDEYKDNDGTPNFPPGDGQFSFMKLEFLSGYSVSGNVTLDGCNGDVTDVLVSIYDNNNGNLVGTDYPDSEGYYEVNGIQEQEGENNYDLEATLSNYETYTYESFTVDENETHNFSLTPYQGTIMVEVINALTGDGIVDAEVDLFDSNDNLENTDNTGTEDGIYAFGYLNNDDGWLCMDDYYAEVSHDNFEDKTTSMITIDENGQSETITVYVDPLSGSISGQVTDENSGEAIADAHVYATNNDEQLFYEITNQSGDYEAADVPAGTWDVTAEAADYTTKTIEDVEVDPNSSTAVNIALSPAPGSLEGTVRANASIPDPLLAGVEVNVVEEETTPEEAVTNESGVYQFSEVPSGTHTVEFSKDGFETNKVEDVVIDPNGTSTADTYMDYEHGTIKVTLNHIANNGAADVTINDEYEANWTGSPNYYYKFSVPQGEYDIDIEHPNKHNATIQDVQVVSGETTYEEFDMVGYHWEFDAGNIAESIWNIYLQEITVDGNPVEVTDEIAIFNSSDQMVGLYYVTSPLSSGNATNQALKAYQNIDGEGTGYTAGNQYTFKLYDQSAGETLTMPDVTLSDPNNEGAYTGNEFPSGSAPFSFAKLAFFTHINISFNLQDGYQLISSRVVTDNMDIGDMFSGGGIRGDLEYVQNEDGLPFQYVNTGWTNNIGDWKVTAGYLVKMSSAFTHTITGTPVNPQKTIYLEDDYNLISYLPAAPMNAADAFSDIKDNLEFVRDSEGDHYWKIGGDWVNNIGNLEPGEGYFVKMTDNDSLVYPTTKGSLKSTDDKKPQHFTFNGGNPKENVYTVYINSDDLEPGDEVAAFDGDKMVGSTVISSKVEGKNNYLNIFRIIDSGEGYQPGNDLTFKVWSPRTGNEYSNVEKEYLDPHNDAHTSNTFPEGDGAYSIVKLSVNELGIGEQPQTTGIRVYPNPADRVLNVECEKKITEIRVTNTIGQVLIHKRVDDDNHTISTDDLESGIYILETTIDGQRTSRRFIVE